MLVQGLADRERHLELAREERAAKAAKAKQEAAAKSPLGALGKRLRAAQRAQQDASDNYVAAEKGANAIVKAMEKCAHLHAAASPGVVSAPISSKHSPHASTYKSLS